MDTVRLPLLALVLVLRTSGSWAAWPPCDGPVVPVPGDVNITEVHLVMMNHLDVGFGEQNGTQEGYVNNVLNEYFEVYVANSDAPPSPVRALSLPPPLRVALFYCFYPNVC